jgi:branched-chain amino acid transport system substrate-binding protein
MEKGRKPAIIAVIATFLFCAPQVLRAQADPIKIGFAHVFSGGMSTFGQVAKQGIEEAVKEINDSGGVLGRRVKLVYADTKVNPEVAKEAIARLVEKENVAAVVGIVSSAVGIAVTPMMKELERPLLITHAMASQITDSLHNKWTFRLTWNLDQCYSGAANLASGLGPVEWTTVGPDYGFGQDSWKYFKKYLSQLGEFDFKEGVFAPLSTQDWGEVIDKLEKSGAEGLLVSLWGNNLKNFIKQAHGRGFFEGKEVICSVGGSVEVFMALRYLDMPKGIWFGSPYWYEAYGNASNKKFVEAYQSLSLSEIPPSYAAYMPYAGAHILKVAMEKAQSAEGDMVAQALSGLTVTNLPVGPTTLRASDHQAVFDFSFGRTSGGSAKYVTLFRGLSDIKRFAGAEVTPLPTTKFTDANEPLE